MNRFVLDLHTHTVASGHAYSTLQEMVAAASAKGIKYLGITEHGPSIPGTCESIYFRNYHVIPRLIGDVRLILGAEMNIIDFNGTIDLDPSIRKHLEIVIAGLHNLCYVAGTKRQNTDAILSAMHNAAVNVISHPMDGTGEVFTEELVKASAGTRTLLEVNNSSLDPVRKKTVARPNNIELLKLARKYDLPVILGSDAHISCSVGDYSRIEPLLKETEFPEQLIVNSNPKLFEEFTGITLLTYRD